MRIPIYQVDAFASRVFAGNPAAVCPVEQWPADEVLQAIAAENNLSETAFLLPLGAGRYHLRWFTPVTEVALCGHATLASAYTVFHRLEPGREEVRFETKSGELPVTRAGDLLTMDFPTLPALPCPLPLALLEGLGARPAALFRGRDYMAVYETEEEVRSLRPDMERLRTLECLGTIATAPGREADFVSRFFAPGAGIPEDPVTGSAHCALAPYWAGRLGKNPLRALQLSARGGEVLCDLRGDRVRLSGSAVLFLEGTIVL